MKESGLLALDRCVRVAAFASYAAFAVAAFAWYAAFAVVGRDRGALGIAAFVPPRFEPTKELDPPPATTRMISRPWASL